MQHNVIASTEEPEECSHRAKRQHVDAAFAVIPYDILEAIFSTLPTPAVVHRIGLVCKDWHSMLKDDELWRLRYGLSELPPGFSSWFAFARRQTMREQVLDHLYGRAGLPQDWCKGVELLHLLARAGDDYAMALYGRLGGSEANSWLRKSKHAIGRADQALSQWQQPNAVEAYRLLTTECDTSDPHVQFLIGVCYDSGHNGGTSDEKQAMHGLNALGIMSWPGIDFPS
eukprot:TRINITY_DN3498_c0_g1_i1.p1 TRINITY_DN3498_c0_g1~~TRINITY_DN3498_c0_g1_i1.p1  ORF type:complete len:228 (+),score=32.56 TRINITY_DN3498_c0_g1_i1:88-771(+)